MEDKILKKLNDQLHMVVNPDRLVRMLAVVNGAKRRGAGNTEVAGQGGQITNVINLTLPTAIVNRYRTNGSNEVVEVNEQGMVGMPAAALLEKIKPNNIPAPNTQLSVTTIVKDVPTTSNKTEIEKDNTYELLERKRKEAALARRDEALAARIDKATIVHGQEY